MSKLINGMKFEVKKVVNPLIKTEVGNIVKVVTTNENSTEFIDITTHDWFIMDNIDIEKYLKKVL